jgi:hypothetical protein
MQSDLGNLTCINPTPGNNLKVSVITCERYLNSPIRAYVIGPCDVTCTISLTTRRSTSGCSASKYKTQKTTWRGACAYSNMSRLDLNSSSVNCPVFTAACHGSINGDFDSSAIFTIALAILLICDVITRSLCDDVYGNFSCLPFSVMTWYMSSPSEGYQCLEANSSPNSARLCAGTITLNSS